VERRGKAKIGAGVEERIPSLSLRGLDLVHDDGSAVLRSGRFEGLTIAAVNSLTRKQAARLGYWQSGRRYIEWLASSENGNEYMRQCATAFLLKRRAARLLAKEAS
jgi:hypothetical protein